MSMSEPANSEGQPAAERNGATPKDAKRTEPHTPGRWTMDGAGTLVSATNPYGHGDMNVADIRGWGHLTGRGGGCAFDDDKAIEIQTANARLIAAAPELLAALKEIVRDAEKAVNPCSRMFNYAASLAAIQKAEAR